MKPWSQPVDRWSFPRRTTATLLILCAAWIGGRQAAVGRAQGQVVDLLTAQFVRTLTNVSTGQQTSVEQGTFRIAPDGTYRVDTVRAGERTAEIVQARGRKRIALNLDTKQAVVGSAASRVVAPSVAPQAIPSGLPNPWKNSEPTRSELGTKVVGDVSLKGTQSSTQVSRGDRQLVNTMESWVYRFEDPRIVPIMMEFRFSNADSVDERRITSATTERADMTVFEIPEGFAIRELP